MKHDIFISYKRLDKDKVFEIKNFIENKTGYKCWIDLDGIESDAQFANVIIRAINDCELFLFMYSHNHTEIDDNDWTVREINFAEDKKKRIVFVNIDNTPLTDWFKLVFGTKQQVDASSDFAMNKLCVDIARWLKSGMKTDMRNTNDALIRIETDLDCRVLRFKEELAIAKADDITEIRLPKGTHKLTFEGLESKEDSYTIIKDIKDLDFEDYVEVKLLDKYNARKEREKALEEDERKIQEEQEQTEREGQNKEKEDKGRKRREKIISNNKWIYVTLTILLFVVAIILLKNNNISKSESEPTIEKPEITGALESEPTIEKPEVRDNYINGHEYVDLGLSVKWATCNVGANKPEDYGNYYAWGETNTKSSYKEDNCTTYGKQMNDISGNPQYDVARKKWGVTWRMPTKAEMLELINSCTCQWTTQNGVKGYKVTGPNGNHIFLPAAGYRNGSSLFYDGDGGIYWSSAPNDYGHDYNAYGLGFYNGGEYVGWGYYRNYGFSVRPITE